MTTIDTSGLLCPAPLIHTKRAIKTAKEGEIIEILLDNQTACSNVKAYLDELGIDSEVNISDNTQHIRFYVPEKIDETISADSFCKPATDTKEYVVVLKSEYMGEGDPSLGMLLMRGFINSLKEADKLPNHIILYNSGVKLAIEGSDTAESLAQMENSGVSIVCCGTCVDFYELKSKIKTGTISNMFRITELTTKAAHIIYP
ncbi:MAG: sulfurtransferase-like selenium metabolism protein YedF [Bacteroidales bacterium]